jgi:hypothetical protein
MRDKLVELTRFANVWQAEMLANLLASEGIDCYLRDNFIYGLYPAVNFGGGVKIDLLEKDLQRAREIMEVYGSLYHDDDSLMQTMDDEP